MPIVSVNLSMAAHDVWVRMPKGRRSARLSYLLVRNYTTEASKTGERVAPILEVGDRRIGLKGEELIWTLEGWQVVE